MIVPKSRCVFLVFLLLYRRANRETNINVGDSLQNMANCSAPLSQNLI